MVFIIFTFIVFIAELIIAFSLIFNLIKFDIKLINANKFLEDAKPKIKNIAELVRGISEQIYELTPIWVEKFKDAKNKLVRKQVESLMSATLFWAINLKIIKHLKRSKILKILWKGLTLVQNVI